MQRRRRVGISASGPRRSLHRMRLTCRAVSGRRGASSLEADRRKAEVEARMTSLQEMPSDGDRLVGGRMVLLVAQRSAQRELAA